MKIRIAFCDGEETTATAAITALLDKLPGVKVHKNGHKPPYNVVFLTTKKPQNPRNSKGNT